MRITRIHTTQPLQDNSTIVLEPDASRHLARVLRAAAGDAVILFDGSGGEYPATITAIDKHSVTVVTGSHLPREAESPLSIHLGIAVSRGERMDWVMQKATELGVTAVTPLVTERTGVKLNQERAEKKIHHWQQIAISACEQCGRNRPPVVHPMIALENWLATTDTQARFVLHHRAETIAVGSAPDSVALLIGPEGGLSDREITLAEKAGYVSLLLGPRILRTESAPLAAIAILQGWWGDMRPAGVTQDQL